jgi:hypothetical protein
MPACRGRSNPPPALPASIGPPHYRPGGEDRVVARLTDVEDRSAGQRVGSALLARVDRPAAPAVLLAVVALVFVVLRMAAAADGSIGNFVYAGSDFARPPIAGVPIHPGPGYDGQFSYRLAVDPADLDENADHIRLDTELRLERIAYPAFAWVGSAGQRSAVPVSLVGVNLLALALLGYLGGRLARASGRHALWGLLLAGYWGYLFSLGRDLHEIVTGLFVLAGLLAYRAARRRDGGGLAALATLSLSVAVLARETALLVVVAIATVRLFDLVRKRDRPRALDGTWVVPIVVFVAWQAVCAAVVGEAPALAAGPAQVGPPVVAMVDAVGTALGDLAHGKRAAAALLLVQLAALAVVVVLAALRLRDGAVLREERLAWVFALVLTLCLSKHFWSGPADLRALSDIYLLSALLLLSGRAPVAARLRSRLPDHRLLLYAVVPAAITFVLTFGARIVEL